MFRKNPYNEATKCIKRESEIGDSEIQVFQIINSNRSKIDPSLEFKSIESDLIGNQDLADSQEMIDPTKST